MKKALMMLIISFLCMPAFSTSTSNVTASNLPVGYWKFDEDSGTTAIDSSGNGNNGTLMNGPQRIEGISGMALNFDGFDDYVSVPHSPSLDISGDQMSVEFWMNLAIDLPYSPSDP